MAVQITCMWSHFFWVLQKDLRQIFQAFPCSKSGVFITVTSHPEGGVCGFPAPTMLTKTQNGMLAVVTAEYRKRRALSLVSHVLHPPRDIFALETLLIIPSDVSQLLVLGLRCMTHQPSIWFYRLCLVFWNKVLLLLALSASLFQEAKREKEGVRPMKTKMSNNSLQGTFGWVLGKYSEADGLHFLFGLSN